jgi:hypothetical protein
MMMMTAPIRRVAREMSMSARSAQLCFNIERLRLKSMVCSLTPRYVCSAGGDLKASSAHAPPHDLLSGEP